MFTLNELTLFLGWCSVINIGVLLFATLILTLFKNPVAKLHSKLFSLNQESLPMVYFQWLGNFKMAIYILNLAPYIVLKIIA